MCELRGNYKEMNEKEKYIGIKRESIKNHQVIKNLIVIKLTAK